jgi:hypothetical protein
LVSLGVVHTSAARFSMPPPSSNSWMKNTSCAAKSCLCESCRCW